MAEASKARGPKRQASALTSAEPVREALQRCGTVFSRLVPVRNSSAEQKNGVPILQWGGVVRNQCGTHGNSAEPVRNSSLPSEYHPRTMMTGLKVSILAKAYIQSTNKSQVRKPPRPLGPKGLGPWARALGRGPARPGAAAGWGSDGDRGGWGGGGGPGPQGPRRFPDLAFVC